MYTQLCVSCISYQYECTVNHHSNSFTLFFSVLVYCVFVFLSLCHICDMGFPSCLSIYLELLI